MLFLRSLLFNILFYANLIGIMIIGLPAMFWGRRGIIRLAQAWGWSTFWLMDKICGIKVEIRGRENLIDKGCIVAAKHQSIWDTFALCTQMRDFTYILKRELLFLPLFGQYLLLADQIAIDRKSRSLALKQLIEQAGAAIAEDRVIFIFPEGTRRQAGAQPAYKSGVTHLYAAAKAPCVPAALNAGLFWPRRSFLRRPGTLVLEFLPVIPAGLPSAEFSAILQARIETATARLIDEALTKNPELAINLAPKEENTTKTN